MKSELELIFTARPNTSCQIITGRWWIPTRYLQAVKRSRFFLAGNQALKSFRWARSSSLHYTLQAGMRNSRAETWGEHQREGRPENWTSPLAKEWMKESRCQWRILRSWVKWSDLHFRNPALHQTLVRETRARRPAIGETWGHLYQRWWEPDKIMVVEIKQMEERESFRYREISRCYGDSWTKVVWREVNQLLSFWETSGWLKRNIPFWFLIFFYFWLSICLI